MDQDSQLKLGKLGNDLNNIESNSIKESIRRGHDELGGHFLDRCGRVVDNSDLYLEYFSGDLVNARKCYYQDRDLQKHVVSMFVNVIKVLVYWQNWFDVSSHFNKALVTPDLKDGNLKSTNHLALVTRLKCAGGRVYFMTRKYSASHTAVSYSSCLPP